MYFLGTFDYAMDERGRLPLPPRYRDAFRDGIVLSQGSPDRCLRAFTTEAFGSQASKLLAQSALHLKGRDLRTSFFSRTHSVELDKQNRILVPTPLREYAQLNGKVLVTGAGEYLEIWAPELFEARLREIDEHLEATLESIETRD